jgi:hypothetical protein
LSECLLSARIVNKKGLAYYNSADLREQLVEMCTAAHSENRRHAFPHKEAPNADGSGFVKLELDSDTDTQPSDDDDAIAAYATTSIAHAISAPSEPPSRTTQPRYKCAAKLMVKAISFANMVEPSSSYGLRVQDRSPDGKLEVSGLLISLKYYSSLWCCMGSLQPHPDDANRRRKHELFQLFRPLQPMKLLEFFVLLHDGLEDGHQIEVDAITLLWNIDSDPLRCATSLADAQVQKTQPLRLNTICKCSGDDPKGNTSKKQRCAKSESRDEAEAKGVEADVAAALAGLDAAQQAPDVEAEEVMSRAALTLSSSPGKSKGTRPNFAKHLDDIAEDVEWVEKSEAKVAKAMSSKLADEAASSGTQAAGLAVSMAEHIAMLSSDDPSYLTDTAACEVDAAVHTAFREANSLLQSAPTQTAEPSSASVEACLSSWSRNVAVTVSIAEEHSKDGHKQHPTSKDISLVVRGHHDGAQGMWLEWFSWDVVSEQPPHYEGRTIRLDELNRIVYALPASRVNITSEVVSSSARLAIPVVGGQMRRVEAGFREALPRYALWVRKSLGAAIDALSVLGAWHHGRSGLACPPGAALSSVTSEIFTADNNRACSICRKRSAKENGVVPLVCPICFLPWHDECQAKLDDVGTSSVQS